jgi:hypothetical protein
LAAKQNETMELTIGEWFSEPGVTFEFSYRVSLYIRQVIKDTIMNPLGLLYNYPEKFLHLTITTTFLQDKLEVKMGPFRKNITSINCGLWFPYKDIMASQKPLEEYVENYIKSIPLIFKRWGVSQEQINEAAEKIRKEIYGNPLYELT